MTDEAGWEQQRAAAVSVKILGAVGSAKRCCKVSCSIDNMAVTVEVEVEQEVENLKWLEDAVQSVYGKNQASVSKADRVYAAVAARWPHSAITVSEVDWRGTGYTTYYNSSYISHVAKKL